MWPAPVEESAPPSWQLEYFDGSLKERQKLALLLRLLGELEGRNCLLVACGPNTGALNFHLRAAGGEWAWTETDPGQIAETRALLGEPVKLVSPTLLPFPDESFQRIVVLDGHRTGEDHPALFGEFQRLLTPGGRAVACTPNGNNHLPFRLLERWLGPTPDLSTPSRDGQPESRSGDPGRWPRTRGLRHRELEALALSVGLQPETRGACSRFFSEAVEWIRLRRRAGRSVLPPPSRLSRLTAALDHLMIGGGGYSVAISMRKSDG